MFSGAKAFNQNICEWDVDVEVFEKYIGGCDFSKEFDDDNTIGGVNVALFLLGGLLCGVCGAFITYLYMSKSNLQPIRSLAARNMNNVHNHEEEQLSSLQMTPTTRTKTHMDQNGNGKIYGLPIEQEDRDII
jgi:hypothetical protein